MFINTLYLGGTVTIGDYVFLLREADQRQCLLTLTCDESVEEQTVLLTGHPNLNRIEMYTGDTLTFDRDCRFQIKNIKSNLRAKIAVDVPGSVKITVSNPDRK